MTRQLRRARFGIAFTALWIVAPSAQATDGVNYHRTDHLLHTATAYALGLTTIRALTNAGVSRPWANFLTGSAIVGFSYLKEKTDSVYDRGDLEAGAVGAGLAVTMGVVLEL